MRIQRTGLMDYLVVGHDDAVPHEYVIRIVCKIASLILSISGVEMVVTLILYTLWISAIGHALTNQTIEHPDDVLRVYISVIMGNTIEIGIYIGGIAIAGLYAGPPIDRHLRSPIRTLIWIWKWSSIYIVLRYLKWMVMGV